MEHPNTPFRWVVPGPYVDTDDMGETPPVDVDWATWRSKGYYDNPQLIDASGDVLISAGGGEYNPVYPDGESGRRLAEFVLRACNAHDALVEACENALRIIKGIDEAEDEFDVGMPSPLRDKLERAIAAAKGEA